MVHSWRSGALHLKALSPSYVTFGACSCEWRVCALSVDVRHAFSGGSASAHECNGGTGGHGLQLRARSSAASLLFIDLACTALEGSEVRT